MFATNTGARFSMTGNGEGAGGGLATGGAMGAAESGSVGTREAPHPRPIAPSSSSPRPRLLKETGPGT
jgi:hypothetical protein